MRVCFLLSGAMYGGAERVVCQLVASLDKSKLFCIVFRKGPFYDNLVEEGIKVYHLDERKHSIVHLILNVRKLLKKERARIVHSHCIKETIIGGLATIGTGASNIATVHGADEFSSENRLRRMYNYFKEEVQHIVLSLRYKAIVVVSPSLKNDFNRYGNNRKAVVITNGILKRQGRINAKRRVIDALGVNGKPFIVGVVGRICEVKNQEYLINVIENNIQRLRGFVFIFVGEGVMLSRLSKKAKKIENIIFLGFRRDSLAIISCCDLLVNTSKREGNPIVVIEAFMLKVPVLASNVPGNNEIVIDGDNGMLFDLENSEEFLDKLLQLKNDSKLREKLANKGYSTYIKEYTSDIMASRYADIYNNVLMKA